MKRVEAMVALAAEWMHTRRLVVLLFVVGAAPLDLGCARTSSTHGPVATPSTSTAGTRGRLTRRFQTRTPAAPAREAVALADVRAEQLDFFEVALVCPAAPKIGCGSRARPALLALLADRRVTGAWLNEAGTRIAIAWRDPRETMSTGELDDLLIPNGLTTQSVQVDGRRELLSTRSNTRWYDSESVQALSDHEAQIIAVRLVKRLAARTVLTERQQEQLPEPIAEIFRSRFRRKDEGDLKDQLQAAIARYGGASILTAFDEVFALGYRPMPGEE